MNPYFDDANADDQHDSTESNAGGSPAGEPSAQPSPEPAPQTEGQSPLLLQDMQTPEELYALPKKSQRPRQVFVAVALLLGAVVAIFAMRHFGAGPAVSLASVDMTYKPSTEGGVSPGKVLAELERSRRAVQVPEDQITQDPFQLDEGTRTVETPVVDPDIERRAAAERERQALLARQKAVQTSFEKLDLQSVMGGKVPVARIDNKLYKIGMTVADQFTITAIAGREVTLTADGREFTLSLGDND